ncbi:MAG: DUF2914 domain-containing protein [Planctomycetota bacterium]
MKKKLIIGGGLIVATLLLSYFIIALVVGESETSVSPTGEAGKTTSGLSEQTPGEFNNIIELTCVEDLSVAGGEEKSLSVSQAVICLGIQNGKPVSPMTILSADNGPVFCWAQVLNGSGKRVRYLWYIEGKVYPSQWIKVDSAQFQTWCKKNIDCKSSGTGVVEIVDETGRVLKTVDFNIVKPSRRSNRQHSNL